ncbi:MAG TPA: polyprenol monophosphomannose synthase [Solirubrobacterales bacterium]|nr:polyprenol monophosphomannose synthase [Solirubrobacterales bacterium]
MPRDWPPGPVWVVLPTYNERQNLEPVVAGVRAALSAAAVDHTILVVDDSSPDGTGELADELAARDPAVQVLHRPRKEGLGQAYIAGFGRALAEGAALVIEMDADMSHDPAHLPAMVSATRHFDLVLGSRYVPGGEVRNWGAMRRLVSRGGCWYARMVLGLGVRDLTGGFKCFRREVLEALDLGRIRSQGYAFQVELTYRAVQRGFRVLEIPIVFTDRAVGHSKMSRRIVLEAMWMVPALRAGRRRFTK